MFEKEIILKEQFAERCLSQCSPSRKLPANAGRLDVQAFKVKVSEVKASHLVYISHPDAVARIVPLNRDAVRDAMPAFFDLLREEPDPAVRVVLGHFIFVYIHPYMDGNGRVGRFLMNTMMASGGYPWTVIPVTDRNTYLNALEEASIGEDIVPFADFLAGLVKKRLLGRALAGGAESFACPNPQKDRGAGNPPQCVRLALRSWSLVRGQTLCLDRCILLHERDQRRDWQHIFEHSSSHDGPGHRSSRCSCNEHAGFDLYERGWLVAVHR
jgi:hypothetical protein